MPWRSRTIVDESARFVFEAEHTDDSFSELCRRYQISRPTGYKWLRRYEAEGLLGLEDRSRRPRVRTRSTIGSNGGSWSCGSEDGGGAPKLQTLLEREFDAVPSISTIHRVLERHDLVRRKKYRRRRAKPAGSPLKADRPNELWTADFKGQFRMGDGQLCYPLTVQDAYSRYLLDCRGMLGPTLARTKRVFQRLFRTHGLPDRIRTDNGQPFASPVSLSRLSQLSVWWIDLGIMPELIQPGKPQQNGRHERMHRTLKREATRPPKKNLAAQQRAFDAFRHTYNDVRPHQALSQQTPGEVYERSERERPDRLLVPEYPAHFETRRVSLVGNIRWNGRIVWVSGLLTHRDLGLEQINDELWAVYYGPQHLGWLDERTGRIMNLRRQSRRF